MAHLDTLIVDLEPHDEVTASRLPETLDVEVRLGGGLVLWLPEAQAEALLDALTSTLTAEAVGT